MNFGRTICQPLTAPCQKRGGHGGRNVSTLNKLYHSLTCWYSENPAFAKPQTVSGNAKKRTHESNATTETHRNELNFLKQLKHKQMEGVYCFNRKMTFSKNNLVE